MPGIVDQAAEHSFVRVTPTPCGRRPVWIDVVALTSTKKPRIVETCATQLVPLHPLAAETWRREHLSKRR